MAPDFNSLRRLVLGAINDRVIPGMVMAVGQAGQVRFVEAFGQRQIDPAPAPATVQTVYDLASLTKALVTSVLVMKGIEKGLLHLDRPLGDHLDLLQDRPEVTLRRVLAHAGGFHAHRRFYESGLVKVEPSPANREAMVRWAAAEPLAYEPGSRSVYSDLGFILLGALVERVMSERLDVLADRLLFRPLGLSTLGFVDLMVGPPTDQFRGLDVAPTERCPVRGRLVVGEVHDLNTFVMGGIAGHAGLFGAVRDVMALAFALCSAYHGRGIGQGGVGDAPLVQPEVLRSFWQPAGITGSTWRLGWDGPSAKGSLAGDLISRGAVGHLSFTGCSLWIDPEQETCVVILTNRVHPEVRDDPRFRALRPALHDAALQAIGYEAK